MSAAPALVDIDDAESLHDADRDGLLRAASMAGAQVRAVASAVAEGVLDGLDAVEHRPRSVVWLAGRGSAESAAAILAATVGPRLPAPLVPASRVPPWIGALDVLVVAGDDAGDAALVDGAALGVRRGARVVLAAPDEGPLREVGAGRAVRLPARIPVPDDFRLPGQLAAGLAVLGAVEPAVGTNLGALADDLDAEVLRDSAGRETFGNPAKALAERLRGRQAVLAGDDAATLALARHGCGRLLRLAHLTAPAVPLADVLAALRGGLAGAAQDYETALFHDEEFDGPLPGRVRGVAVCTDERRHALTAALSGFDDLDVLSASGALSAADVLGAADALGSPAMSDRMPERVTDRVPPAATQPEGQLAVLSVRLEMAAVYLRLLGGTR